MPISVNKNLCEKERIYVRMAFYIGKKPAIAFYTIFLQPFIKILFILKVLIYPSQLTSQNIMSMLHHINGRIINWH
jgi:hypothetical protein